LSNRLQKRLFARPLFSFKFFIAHFFGAFPHFSQFLTNMIATTKRQLGNDENADPERPSEEAEKDDTQLNGVLPLTRVKRLIKMSAMTNTNVSAGAAKLIQLCAVSCRCFWTYGDVPNFIELK
jgi:hypothetical protein